MRKIDEIRKLKKENSFLLISMAIIFLLFIGVIFAASSMQSKPQLPVQIEKQSFVSTKDAIAKLSENAILLRVPAIDKEGNGVVTTMSVEANEGSGKTLVDIDGLFFFTDTQESIVSAKNVAADVTGLDLRKYDITYTIYANANSIGGPSAGAALTIATIAALQDLKLNENVMITGRILPDGRVGTVSAIAAKGIVAKDSGATLFLVPPSQSTQIIYNTKRTCQTEGDQEICTIEKVMIEKNIGDDIGIEIREVSTIREALDYFTQ